MRMAIETTNKPNGQMVDYLPPSEMLVLRGIADGLTAKEIAHRAGKSVHTVKIQMERIRRRAGSPSSAGALWRFRHLLENSG